MTKQMSNEASAHELVFGSVWGFDSPGRFQARRNGFILAHRRCARALCLCEGTALNRRCNSNHGWTQIDTDDGRLLTRTARMIANSSAAPLVRANSRNSRWASLPNPRSSGVLQIIM